MRAWIRYTAAIYPNTSWRHEIELLPQEAARLAICRTSFYKLRDLRSCFYVTQLGSEEGQGQPCRPVGSPTSIPSHVEYWTCRYFGILILLLFPEVPSYTCTVLYVYGSTEVRKYFPPKRGVGSTCSCTVHYYDTLLGSTSGSICTTLYCTEVHTEVIHVQYSTKVSSKIDTKVQLT